MTRNFRSLALVLWICLGPATLFALPGQTRLLQFKKTLKSSKSIAFPIGPFTLILSSFQLMVGLFTNVTIKSLMPRKLTGFGPLVNHLPAPCFGIAIEKGILGFKRQSEEVLPKSKR